VQDGPARTPVKSITLMPLRERLVTIVPSRSMANLDVYHCFYYLPTPAGLGRAPVRATDRNKQRPASLDGQIERLIAFRIAPAHVLVVTASARSMSL
jgi:hypothetical protein